MDQSIVDEIESSNESSGPILFNIIRGVAYRIFTSRNRLYYQRNSTSETDWRRAQELLFNYFGETDIKTHYRFKEPRVEDWLMGNISFHARKISSGDTFRDWMEGVEKIVNDVMVLCGPHYNRVLSESELRFAA